MNPHLSPAERALVRADRADLRSERAEILAAVVAVAFSVPAMAAATAGVPLAWMWVLAVLGAPPLLDLERRCGIRWRLARHPVQPPRPTTRMWFQEVRRRISVGERLGPTRVTKAPSRSRRTFLRR